MRAKRGIAIALALLAILSIAAVLLFRDSPSNTTSTAGPLPSVPPVPPGAMVLTAAGDICGATPATCSVTADLSRSLFTVAVLTLGYNQ